jgi:ubiquinone/menaquinone biosynthesis C-methylase UbiE
MDITKMANNHICPVELAGSLDSKIRRWFQNPKKILRPYIKEGMTVIDLGCGPGFFTIDMAQMVGETGRVIAADLQKEMLQKLENKIRGTEIEDRINLHQCEEDKIGINEEVDFILAFYMVHEATHQDKFFNDIKSILKTSGQMLIVEPPIHVSWEKFSQSIRNAKNAGLLTREGPNIPFNKTAIIRSTLKSGWGSKNSIE